MSVVLTLVLIGWITIYVRPIVRDWLAPDEDAAGTVGLTAAGLGLGFATLVASCVMMAAPGSSAFAWSLAATALVAAAGVAIRLARPARARPPAHESRRRSGVVRRALQVAIALSCTGIVFTSVYWPFDVGDALALYAPWARHLFTTRALPLGEGVYESYPMLLPMAYAFTHWAAGGVNEYLARIVPALMAIGTTAVSGALGRAMGGPGVGLWAASLVAMTPIFGRWASSGYTDIPAAFYVGLTVLFAWRWWLTGSTRAIVLTGVCAGLAAWTKNSTLTLVPSIAVLVLGFPIVNAWWPAGARMPARSIARSALLASAAFLAVAGPWYLRSHLVFGSVVPPTMLLDQVDHTWRALVIMLRPDQSFGLSGVVFTVAPLVGLAVLIGRRDRTTAAWYVLLVFLVPFHVVWWRLASYEARFLLAIIPVFAGMGALTLDAAAARIAPRLSPRTARAATFVVLVVILAATATAWRRTVMHKRVLMERPWPSDVERHQVRLGGLYDLARALNALPHGSRVGGVPGIIRYHLAEDRLPFISSAPEADPPDRLQDRYDAVVYHVLHDNLPWHTSLAPLLHTQDGYLLYATRPTPAPAMEALP